MIRRLLLDDLSLMQIFFFLSPEELSLRVGQVCKQWYNVAIRNDIWRFMCYKCISVSGKNSKIGVDEFFDRNSIDTSISEQFFKKAYYDKKLKTNLLIIRNFDSRVTVKSMYLENDVSLLKYIPLTQSKEKKSINFTVKYGEKPEFIDEIIRHRDLICVSEHNHNYVVVNLCEVSPKQSRKNLTGFKILCKYVMKLSHEALSKSKRWEYKLIESSIFIQSLMKGQKKKQSCYDY
ncbi:Hypothetical protein NAEGRDRAFT_67711 [Naegleria gruberi]|uniref:F-box domain-containing protein n=1 Tax=Naegleria gruberi TaxID=5762 RepID=D2VFQ9_NAEGR|nr:uncharacterized protein NAEGRDRAFT_67711 [Naegleria gruberi]EFC44515.1 Hypothetical protein NAEGRDRAFT_67711 [Naegleria gruberi]|eukprot:XP_002677259.1 Hypothetical protein NAEGRDRAFT_67711 [Naegleria gruberi strain NEG-M]